MTTETPAPPEVLIARTIPWRKRLWVRIALVLMVGAVAMSVLWVWPRRGMIAVWQVNGVVYSDSANDPATSMVK